MRSFLGKESREAAKGRASCSAPSTMRPFFGFYGGKWRDAPKYYPAPEHDTIVERAHPNSLLAGALGRGHRGTQRSRPDGVTGVSSPVLMEGGLPKASADGVVIMGWLTDRRRVGTTT